MDYWRRDTEIRFNKLEILVLLQFSDGASKNINAVTSCKQLLSEGFSDSGTTTCNDIVFHRVKIVGVMFAKAIYIESTEPPLDSKHGPPEEE